MEVGERLISRWEQVSWERASPLAEVVLLLQGTSVVEVQALLGHADLSSWCPRRCNEMEQARGSDTDTIIESR